MKKGTLYVGRHRGQPDRRGPRGAGSRGADRRRWHHDRPGRVPQQPTRADDGTERRHPRRQRGGRRPRRDHPRSVLSSSRSTPVRERAGCSASSSRPTSKGCTSSTTPKTHSTCSAESGHRRTGRGRPPRPVPGSLRRVSEEDSFDFVGRRSAQRRRRAGRIDRGARRQARACAARHDRGRATGERTDGPRTEAGAPGAGAPGGLRRAPLRAGRRGQPGRGVPRKEVGGIAIKRETLEPDRWIAALTEDLRAEAERSAGRPNRARAAARG